MTILVDTVRFSRAPDLLWRDTGRSVLVLSSHASEDVLVLGGGSGAVWRLLSCPRSVQELMDEFERTGAAAPDPASLCQCIDDLAARGVIQASRDDR